MGVEDFVFVVMFGSTFVLTDFGGKVLLDLIRSLQVPRAIQAVFKFVEYYALLLYLFQDRPRSVQV